jgi:polar amino acid transport system substrate-binding protein
MKSATVLTAAAAIAAFALAACTHASETAGAGQPTGAAPTSAHSTTEAAALVPDDLKGKQLHYATDASYPPFEMFDKDNTTIIGFDADVMSEIAGRLGVTFIPVNTGFDGILTGLAAGRYDAAISSFSITEERKNAVDFSSPYYDVTQAIVTIKSSPAAKVTSLGGVKGLRLGAQVGTTSYDAAKALGTSAPVAVYNNNDDAKAALTSGQIDALVLDLPTAFEVQSELTDGTIVGQLPPGTDKSEQFGIVLDKGSKLTACVSGAVDGLRADGTLAKLQQQWLAEVGSAPVLK